jgi:hypothetical protein
MENNNQMVFIQMKKRNVQLEISFPHFCLACEQFVDVGGDDK